jgi:signal transduction histidine kinase
MHFPLSFPERVRLLGQSFQAKLLLTLLLPLLVIWSLVALTSTSMQERQQAFVGKQQAADTKRVADELQEKIQDRVRMLESIAAHVDMAKWKGPQAASDYLAQRYALRPMFSGGTIIFDPSGTVLGEYPVVAGRLGSNYADREYLQRFFATGKPTVSEPYMGRLQHRMLMSMCVPIAGANSQVQGALCGNFDMRSSNFLGRMSDPQAMGSKGFFLLRNSDRVLIASTDSSRVMTQMPDTPLLRQVLAGNAKAFVASSSVGIEKLYASAPVEAAGWTLVLALPTEIAFAPVRATVDALKRDALLASLLVMWAAYFLARRILRPLQQAGLRMDAMSGGREPLQRVDETGDTEVRRLLTSFNRLSDSLVSQQTLLQDERNAFLSEVLEMLPFGVVVLNQERHVSLRNKLFGTLLDYPDSLLSQQPLQFADWMRFNFERGDFPGEALQDVLDRYIQFMERRQPICFERPLSNGVYLEVRGQPLANGWTLLTYTDISAHKQLAQQLTDLNQALARQIKVSNAATDAKSAFVAKVSYEIRTPMNAILGLSYLLEKAALPGYAHDMVVKMRIASTSLLSSLNDVLDFSKMESGKLDIQSNSFCLGDVLDNLATIMSANTLEKDLELIIAPTPSGTSQLIGDPLRLEQVLINLTGNAIKFTERGHVALSVSKVQEQGAFLTLRFSVRDSGIGIARDKQREVFAEFAQADGTTSRKYGGSGLGLAISRRLVAAMGGELQVASALDSGSEFWFELRFQRAGWSRPAVPTLLPLQDAV